MSTPNLPQQAIQMIASEQMRTHHARWHFVRNRWHTLTPAQQSAFESIGFKPPRLDPISLPGDSVAAPPRDPGAGLDFLFMHRKMIERLNALLASINDQNYPTIIPWDPIPWDHNDPDWPMPPSYSSDVNWAKTQSRTDFYKSEAENKFESNSWLQGRDLDDIGAEIENGIHNWMHMHWSRQPWYQELPGQDPNDPRNDYLGSTYSSHVNKAFWKLHGWIDSRIDQWEAVNNTQADFSQGWEGPAHHHASPQPVSPMALSVESIMKEGFDLSSSLMPLTDLEKQFSKQKFMAR